MNILDGILIANEIVDGWKRSSQKGLALKLDFEKPYDSINWEFLLDLLSKFGFGTRWASWMKTCVSSAKIFVLVNGSPTPEFCPQRGLKINYHKSAICGVGGGRGTGAGVCFLIPVGVAKEIKRLQSSFLWGSSNLRRNIHMVQWVVVTKNKKLGGLGVRRIKNLNQCLLLKWWWRFGVENQSLWKEVICAKYMLVDGRWLPKLIGRGSKLWSDIIHVVLSNPELHQFYINNSQIVLRDERRVLLWRDKWVGNIRLMDEFHRLLLLSNDKNGVLLAGTERRRIGLLSSGCNSWVKCYVAQLM
ncbi:uncharacterized protein LOC114275182 [Camellia sinensis]|uniref:uncharacterized protein LOC114275182 n=1 Tax=Camellia sinensis TaxID=4442 RepID=UPI00103556D7|nr:uncharacterized protein LOC114275182 [Camellia sinensis]